MNINTFLKKLKDAKNKSCLENAYSHIIYELFSDVLDTDKYSLVDTTSLKRNKTNPKNSENDQNIKSKILAPNNIVAVPDFVITSSDFDYSNDIYKIDSEEKVRGCIEVKFYDKDVENTDRLENRENNQFGYLSIYQKVIYTNGWIWKYYNKEKNNCQKVDFRQNPSNKEYGKLLNLLCSIEWGN